MSSTFLIIFKLFLICIQFGNKKQGASRRTPLKSNAKTPDVAYFTAQPNPTPISKHHTRFCHTCRLCTALSLFICCFNVCDNVFNSPTSLDSIVKSVLQSVNSCCNFFCNNCACVNSSTNVVDGFFSLIKSF